MMKKDISDIDKNMAVALKTEDGFDWYGADSKPFVLDGAYWHKPGDILRRLPLMEQVPGISGNVDFLSWHTAGLQLRFKTDSKEIRLKYKVHYPSRMDHMAFVGSMGFDIYTGSGLGKTYAQSFRIADFMKDDFLGTVYQRNDDRGMVEFTLNFPLYSGVKEFAVGLTAGAKVAAPAPWPDARPILVYGSSIQQGGCASRPGMCHTNILSRKLNRPFLNFGFSGSGLGEPVMAEIFASVKDPAMFVLDYNANAEVEGMRKTLSPFIDILRKKHPLVPILMVSRTIYADEVKNYPATYAPERIEFTKIHLDELERRRKAGDKNIHFLDGTTLFGSEPLECMVDGVHATDLGFMETAKRMAPVIEKILEG